MSKEEPKSRPRRKNARSTETVIALLEERISMMESNGQASEHTTRALELLDELNRSLGRKGAGEEA